MVGNQSIPSATQTATHHASPAPSTSSPAESRKAALLIGCSYEGNDVYHTLRKPHEDVFKVKNLLLKTYRFDKMDVTVLLDDGQHLRPTRENILNGMNQLMEGAKAGDCFFLHYSGHGVQTPCQVPGEEPDDLDEAIVPCDATDDKETWIIDNDLNKLLVRKIPVNAQLIAIFDMCHSGTAMDLKHYCYNENGTIHQYKRTSHDIIEDDSRVIRELCSCHRSKGGRDTFARNTTPIKDTRQFTYTKRKSTLHCELSEGPESGLTAIARRYTYPYFCEQDFRRMRKLRWGFIPQFCKSRLSISGKGANDEKADHAELELKPPLRVLTATSLTPLNSSTTNHDICYGTSIPTPRASVPASLHSSSPFRVSANTTELAPMHTASKHADKIPRCMSPDSILKLPSRSNTSETPALGSWTTDVSTTTTIRQKKSKRLMTRTTYKPGMTRKKCGCRSSSGGRARGQTITVAASSDEQVAWETRKGTLTSALVGILEKDPHPTYDSLLASVQKYLNDLSDRMRREYFRTKKHREFVARRIKVRKWSTPRQNERKSKRDIGAEMLKAIEATLKQANGGSVQTVFIGSELYMDIAKTRFDPSGRYSAK